MYIVRTQEESIAANDQRVRRVHQQQHMMSPLSDLVTMLLPPPPSTVLTSAANRLIGEVVQSRRRPLLGPSPG